MRSELVLMDLRSTSIGNSDLAIPLIDSNLHNGQPKGYVSKTFCSSSAWFILETVGIWYHIWSFCIPTGVKNQGLKERVGTADFSCTRTVNDDGNREEEEDTTEDTNTRTPHPDRGAYTHYDNVTLQSTTFIPAGVQIVQNTVWHSLRQW